MADGHRIAILFTVSTHCSVPSLPFPEPDYQGIVVLTFFHQHDADIVAVPSGRSAFSDSCKAACSKPPASRMGAVRQIRNRRIYFNGNPVVF